MIFSSERECQDNAVFKDSFVLKVQSQSYTAPDMVQQQLAISTNDRISLITFDKCKKRSL